MFNYKIIIEYDGSSFFVWQKQDNGPTIQESVEDSLRKLTSENVTLFGAGRTDSGVHALGQVAHFDLNKKFSSEWPNISKKKTDITKEGQDKWAKVKDKKEHFSEKPGKE